MKKTFIFFILFFSTISITAQDIDDLNFGTDSTFELITWNIEWFPKNGQTTVDYVKQIIEALDVDLLAIQEVSDTTMFKQMMNDLEDYTGYFQSGWFAGLAYIYKTDVVEINDIYEIYTTEPYWRPFPRSPMVMDLNFSGENFIIINNHFKCCGDGILNLNDPYDEETRRYDASNLLKEFVDTYFPESRVIITGDLNDILTDNEGNNVFQTFLDDSENYTFADMNIAIGDSEDWSYPTWPSHLDHHLVTNDLFDEFENDTSGVLCIRVDDYLVGGWDTYETNISDHRPVAIKINPDLSSAINESNTSNLLYKNYPNPFNESTNFIFVSFEENSEIEIYNIRGEKVDSVFVPKGSTTISWNARNLSSGIYFSKFRTRSGMIKTLKIVILK